MTFLYLLPPNKSFAIHKLTSYRLLNILLREAEIREGKKGTKEKDEKIITHVLWGGGNHWGESDSRQ